MPSQDSSCCVTYDGSSVDEFTTASNLYKQSSAAAFIVDAHSFYSVLICFYWSVYLLIK